jgi:PAS domain-containing protein
MTDPSLSDNPIVYVNDAWEEITGYDCASIMGRNPRLLHGTSVSRRGSVAPPVERLDRRPRRGCRRLRCGAICRREVMIDRVSESVSRDPG